MARYWVGTDGSNSNNGLSSAAAKATISGASGAAALLTEGAGDTLTLKAGTYTDNILDSIPSGGGSWEDATIIEPYESDVVVLKPDTANYDVRDTHIYFEDRDWIIFRNIEIDHDDVSSSTFSAPLGLVNNCTYVRVATCDIHGATNYSGGAVYLTSYDDLDPGPQYCEILTCEIHHNQAHASDNQHGIYISINSHDCIFRGNHVHNMDGFGIHLYTNSAVAKHHRNLIEKNWLQDNGETGAIMAGGDDNVFRNNLITGSGALGLNLSSYALNRPLVYSNTFYNNGGYAMSIGATQNITDAIIKNNIFWSNGTDDILEGPGTVNLTQSNNLEGTDPEFLAAGANNFRIAEGSPAENAGADLSAAGVTEDFDGNARPQGAGHDIGCYERVVVDFGAAASNRSAMVAVGIRL